VATHNNPPLVGTVMVDFSPNAGISYEVQSGAEDNQGTVPAPFTSSLTFQYGSGSLESDNQRLGAVFQGDANGSTREPRTP